MLTREEAKTKICPYTFENNGLTEEALLNRDKALHDMYNEHKITSKDYADARIELFKIPVLKSQNCTAEECPKWVDFVIDKLDYKGERTILHGDCEHCPEEKRPNYMTQEYANKCLYCKYHIGRCGG